MSPAQNDVGIRERHLRVWPGAVAVVLQWLLFFGTAVVMPDYLLYGLLGGLACGLIVLVWWLFFSRTPQMERWVTVALVVAAAFATSSIIDRSIAGGMMGYMFPFFSIPVMSLGLVAGAVAGRRLATGPRRVAMAAAILVVCGICAAVRTEGITGEGRSQLHWRWSQTSEQKLLAAASELPATPPAAPVATLPAAPKVETPREQAAERSASEPAVHPAALRASLPKTPPSAPAAVPAGAEWPGFRGPHRDGIVTGVRIRTDWAASPPVQLWRREVGPGWSSFAVADGRIYTQEQRGDFEVVACYNETTGVPVWIHRDATRFWESNGGAGPRGTPTLFHGRAYTFGATGVVNALDAGNGTVLWTRNAAADAGVKTPGWGFSSSPLVVGDMVVVAAAGKLVAYDIASGAPRWLGPDGGDSYSSPELATIDGVPQILLMSAVGATSVSPEDGKLLWKHPWRSDTRIMQPAVTADGDLLITAGDAMGGVGMRRIAIAHGPAGWTTQERWTTTGLKPAFNDTVVHKGHAYGFDGSILACIDLKDGTRTWKGGRYGSGQLILLADQDLLLVVSEEGELVLVSATPDRFNEIARFPAIEGKTWNHPVLAGDTLLVRNDREMAAFRLSPAGG